MANSLLLTNWTVPALSVFAWVLTYFIHSALLTGVVWLIARQRFIKSNHVREWLWKTALVGGLLTSSVQMLLGLQPLTGKLELPTVDRTVLARMDGSTPPGQQRAVPQSGNVVRMHLENGHVVIDNSSAQQEFDRQSNQSAKEPSAAPVFSLRDDKINAGAIGISRLSERSLKWLYGIAAVWALLFGLLAIRVWLSQRRWAKLIKDRHEIQQGSLQELLVALVRDCGFRHPVRLSCCSQISVPVALRGCEICVPMRALTALSNDEQQSMLAHEFGHIVRRDVLWRRISAVIEAVFFFQPLNHLARKHIQEEAEYLCDDWAVSQTGEGLSLAKCLAEVAEWTQSSPHSQMAAAMADNTPMLVRRVERLLADAPAATVKSIAYRRAGQFALICVLLALTIGIAPRIGVKQERIPMKYLQSHPVEISIPSGPSGSAPNLSFIEIISISQKSEIFLQP